MRRAPAEPGYRQARALMDTVVSIDVPGDGGDASPAVERAFGWFTYVERVCSRFDEESEVVRLGQTVGKPVPVSSVLFQAVSFALALGRQSGGAFDTTVGGLMERRGFDRNYRTGRRQFFADGSRTGADRDIVLDAEAQTITLRRALLLDLGAVAKGLAIDLAAQELAPLGDYAIDAGGDLSVRGRRPGGAWRVGIQHPRQPAQTVAVLELVDAAVCTSGDYRRRASDGAQHHLVDPRTGASPVELASLTVVAPTAMLADGLSTAAFILGAEGGLALISDEGAEGMAITRTLERRVTPGFDALLLGEA